MNQKTKRANVAEKLINNFPYYASKCLKIRTKEAKIEPLRLNKAQLYVHAMLEEQKRKTGKVRARILKGRQQGMSTYIEARFYHRTSTGKGLRAFILAHEKDAATNLFKLAQRYHENCPGPMKPATDYSNRQELSFSGTDCSYRVATAGVVSVGRSETIQLFHGSEVAFWPHGDTHASGALEAVPNAPGTEIILESTGNGMGDLFYVGWSQTAKGKDSSYINIFVPWFWQDEYQIEVPGDFFLTKEEEEYMNAHKVPMRAMAWRREKISDLGIGGDEKFQREYPATATEAFMTSGKNLLIKPEWIIAARKGPKDVVAYGARIGGCDPAGGDEEDTEEDIEKRDRTAFVIRQGRIILYYEFVRGFNTMQVVSRAAELIVEFRLDMMFVDNIGLGAGVVDRLKELDHPVMGINAGSSPNKPDRYYNKRAEMAGEMAEWYQNGPVVIPDDDEYQADLMCIRRVFDGNSCLRLEPKTKIRKDFKRSPDLFDAQALTHAMAIAPSDPGGRSADEEFAKQRRDYNPYSRRRAA